MQDETPLHCAAGSVTDGSGRCALILLTSGSDPNVVNDVRDLADAQRCVLSTQGLKVNASPLHLAAAGGSIEIVDMLLKAKADPNTKNKVLSRPAA